MTDEIPELTETGDAFMDGVMFAVVTAIWIGAMVIGSHLLTEMFRRKDSKTPETER